MNKLKLIIYFTLFIFISCSSTKPGEDQDLQLQFDKGMKYLEKKKYLRAQEEFNAVVIRGTHTDLGDDAQFYLAESYFLNKEYILAIAEYDRLIRRMGFSEYVLKARWRVCQSYVEQSPKYYHEQSSSEHALSKLQEFLDDYPNSEFQEEALSTISILRSKLAKKLYETGRLYMKMDEYASAIITYEDLLANYYDTELVSIAHAQVVKCHVLSGDINAANEYLADHKNQIAKKDLVVELENYIRRKS